MQPIHCATTEERTAEGRNRRNVVPRTDHANLRPKDRQFDPIDILLASEADRLPDLLPLKHARMKVSSFAFFRGAVAIMAADLGRLPTSGLTVQLCGDAHVQNLGSFAAPDGKLVFDFNDFDETIQGPWEWDVKRMAASLVLAGRVSGHERSGCETAVEAFLSSYCRWVEEFSREPILQAARHQVRREKQIEAIGAALRQSQRAHPMDLLAKFTKPDRDGCPRFTDQPPLLRRIQGEEAQSVLDSLASYRETLPPERRHLFDLIRVVDVGFRVVGTGSVGMRDYVVLLEGNGPNDPIFLQIKQQVASAYAKFVPGNDDDRHHGQRVVQGQRAIQPLSDLLLGWTTIGADHYTVRQLNDHKGSIDITLLRGSGIAGFAAVAGELLARGHARSGDACRISGYCGSGAKIVKALAAFAIEYANQTEADYNSFLAKIKAGKIPV